MKMLTNTLNILLSLLFNFTFATPPNIVLFLADDLGYNDISWNNPHVQSPNLQDLASSGIILEQHYSQALCTPSRGSLLTGKYPIHNGLNNGVIASLCPYGLDVKHTLLPQELQRAGYQSHIVGKWHLGFCNRKFWPQNRGFDSYYGFLTGMEGYYNHFNEDHWNQEDDNTGGYDFRDDFDVAWDVNGTYSTILIQERAKKIISKHNPETPLFLYVPFQSVHEPFEVPDEYVEMYANVNDKARSTYLGMVTAMDDAVGNITQALKDHGLYDNTIIIWFSDNGGPEGYEASNWPLRGSKYTLFEGGTRTPAMIHSPTHLPQDLKSDLWIHISDWYPTILSMAGLTSTQTGLDGLDQWPQLQDPTLMGQRMEMVYNIHYMGPGEDDTPVAAIRKGPWKYIKRVNGFIGWTPCPPEICTNSTNNVSELYNEVRDLLFNVIDDPTESFNLYEFEPEIVEDLDMLLEEYIAALPDEFYPKPDPSGDPSNFGGVYSYGWC